MHRQCGLLMALKFFYFRLNTLIDELAEMITERCRLYRDDFDDKPKSKAHNTLHMSLILNTDNIHKSLRPNAQRTLDNA